MNILIFISYILTIGLKTIDSPTLYIIEFIKKQNGTNINTLEDYLFEKKILDIRFKKLKNEKLIKITNQSLELTKSGKLFVSFMNFFANIFKIKSEG